MDSGSEVISSEWWRE